MSEESESWQQYKDEQRQRRRERLEYFEELVRADIGLLYEVEAKTPYQYRINKTIDIYPIHKRWHNIKTNKRGSYKSLSELLKEQIT